MNGSHSSPLVLFPLATHAQISRTGYPTKTNDPASLLPQSSGHVEAESPPESIDLLRDPVDLQPLQDPRHGPHHPAPQALEAVGEHDAGDAHVRVAPEPAAEPPHVVVEELDAEAGTDDLDGDPAGEPLALDDVGERNCGRVGDGGVEQDEAQQVGLEDGGAAEPDEVADARVDGVGHAGP